MKINLTKVRFILERITPEFLFNFILLIWRIIFLKFTKEYKLKNFYINLYCKKYGSKILKGPFKDMRYSKKQYYQEVFLKLIGEYEIQLEQIIKYILKRKYKIIIDVGCAKGYYSTGFALNTKAKIIAYDSDSICIKMAKKNARINQVEKRIEFLGKCSIDSLKKNIKKNTLIFMDVEGYEKILLDVSENKKLMECDILVETHDLYVKNISKKIKLNFKNTHRVKEIFIKSPKFENNLFYKDVKKEDREYVFCERAYKDQIWLFLEKK